MLIHLLLVLLLAPSSKPAPAEVPFAESSFSDASKLAAKEGKVVFIDFFTTWCGPCKMLDQNTWRDSAVINLLEEKTVPLKIDAEKHARLAGRYRVDAYPTMLLLKPDGTVIDRLVGYRDPKTFISDFTASLNGKDSVARAAAAAAEAGNNDPMTRMQLARAYAEKQQYAKALDLYLWCFDHGAQADPAFIGVRGSFLLGDIAQLGQHYPPALRSLESRRDRDQARLLGASADASTLQDLIALNRCLGRDDKTLALYDRLPRNSRARGAMRKALIGQFLESKRYAEIVEGADPQAAFARQTSLMRDALDQLGKTSPMRREAEKAFRHMAVITGANYFEALAGLKKDDQARTLAGEILQFDDSPATRQELVRRARRAGNAELLGFLKEEKPQAAAGH